MRRLAAVLLPGFAAVLPAIWLMLPPGALPARYGAGDCRRVTLTDTATGRPVTGAEDIAPAPDGDTLIVSAHDRLDAARPDGGLYAVSARALGGGSDAVPARPLADRLRAPGPLRPHGIALSPDGTRLAVINRIAPGRAEIEVGALGPAGWAPERRIADARLCRANDLAFTGPDALEVTLDRADCTTSLRDLSPFGTTGSIARIAGDRVEIDRTGLAFPNGIAGDYLAESRASRLLRPAGPPIALPGAPDNLSQAGGALLVALHPALIRTWLYLGGWLGRAPSRIVRVEPQSGAVEILFDDPAGARFSAATVAVLANGRLIAGSARDAGLLVCGGAG